MSIIGNIIWIIFGGIFIFLEYIIAGVLMCLTIVGIPFGLKIIQLSVLGLAPFGQRVQYNEHAGGCLTIVLNVIWVFIGGLPIALTHLFFALLFAITIIGIPFASQHIKLAGFALIPFGKSIR
ncbi:YccF domain-containing protein [Labilibaculum sp.]|uniref:YccF domain-containing protein n=1 Tax=Labilibaculum sp. TaxID=2060723 RepID=UPI003567901E